MFRKKYSLVVFSFYLLSLFNHAVYAADTAKSEWTSFKGTSKDAGEAYIIKISDSNAAFEIKKEYVKIKGDNIQIKNGVNVKKINSGSMDNDVNIEGFIGLPIPIPTPCFLYSSLTIYVALKPQMIAAKDNKAFSYEQCRGLHSDGVSEAACQVSAAVVGLPLFICGADQARFLECLCNDVFGR